MIQTLILWFQGQLYYETPTIIFFNKQGDDKNGAIYHIINNFKHMKRYIFTSVLILCMLFSTNSKAQTGIEWQTCYGSAYGIGTPKDACKTPDGGYIIVGVTQPNDTSGMWPYQMGDGDFGVIRIDSVGNLIWKKTYGGNKLDGAYCVIKGIRSDRYYIAGVSRSEGSTNYHSPSTNGDAWLIAIDSAGTMLWERCYGGYEGETFNSLVQLGDSNIIYGIGLTGSPNNGDVTGNYNSTVTGWICKINANTGMLIHQKCYGGSRTDQLVNSTKLNNNNILIQAGTESIDHDVWTYYGTNIGNGWLLNIDTSLNIVWQKTIGSSGGAGILDVIKTQDGGFAVFGSTVNRPGDTSCFNFYVGLLPSGLAKKEIFIIKYDSLGIVQWQQHYGAPLDHTEFEGRFVQMQDKGFVFSTRVSKWNGFALWPYNHGSVLFRTDSAGNLLSTSRYGNGQGGSSLNVINLFTTLENKLVVISMGVPACNFSGGWSAFQIGHQLSIKNDDKSELPIKVYPNPSSGVFNIEFDNVENISRIVVYNTLGQIVKTVSTKQATKSYKLDLSGNSKGLYFIGIEVDNTMVFKKVVLE